MDIPRLVEEKICKYIDLIYFKKWREKITSVNKEYLTRVTYEYNYPGPYTYVEYREIWSPYNYRNLQTKNNYHGEIYTLKGPGRGNVGNLSINY